jgi:hypothetical protein
MDARSTEQKKNGYRCIFVVIISSPNDYKQIHDPQVFLILFYIPSVTTLLWGQNKGKNRSPDFLSAMAL